MRLKCRVRLVVEACLYGDLGDREPFPQEELRAPHPDRRLVSMRRHSHGIPEHTAQVEGAQGRQPEPGRRESPRPRHVPLGTASRPFVRSCGSFGTDWPAAHCWGWVICTLPRPPLAAPFDAATPMAGQACWSSGRAWAQ